MRELKTQGEPKAKAIIEDLLYGESQARQSKQTPTGGSLLGRRKEKLEGKKEFKAEELGVMTDRTHSTENNVNLLQMEC